MCETVQGEDTAKRRSRNCNRSRFAPNDVVRRAERGTGERGRTRESCCQSFEPGEWQEEERGKAGKRSDDLLSSLPRAAARAQSQRSDGDEWVYIYSTLEQTAGQGWNSTSCVKRI